MLELIEYTQEMEGICIRRCYGGGSYLAIPAKVSEKPVVSLADHVFARDPSRTRESVSFACRREDAWEPCAAPEEEVPCPAMCAEGLTRIDLPLSIRKIGDYAFYGCRNLERVTMSAALENLGGGAFVAANHVKELVFIVPPPAARETAGNALPAHPAVRSVLAEISYEIGVCIRDVNGKELARVHFPEYYEDAVENTPARIFEMKFEGTGFKYRQCFKDGRIDFPRYDSLFYEASVQEFAPTVLTMVFDRLLWPVSLQEEDRRAYLDYVRADMNRFVRWCGEKAGASGPDLMQIMRCLCGEEFFDRDSLALCMDMAARKGQADVVSLLGEYRRTHFGREKVRDRYSL